MKKFLSIIIICVLLSLSLVSLVGCKEDYLCPHGYDKRNDGGRCLICNPYPEPLTLEEIEANIQEEYFNDDGTWRKEVWEYKHALNPQFEMPEEITGFEVQYLKDEDGDESWYLFEFEPTCYIVGARNQKWLNYSWKQSYYKILNIPKEERYIYDYYGEILCTKYNGYLVQIGYDVRVKNGEKIFNGRDITLYTKYFNYEKHSWEWILRSELED